MINEEFVCIFPEDKLFVILEYLEFQKERRKEKKKTNKIPPSDSRQSARDHSPIINLPRTDRSAFLSSNDIQDRYPRGVTRVL